MVEVLRRCGGSAGTGELLSHVSRRSLAGAAASGALVRVRRGRYALPELPAPRVAAERMSGAASGLSAAQLWDLPVLLPPSRASVTVRPNAHRAGDRAVDLKFAPLTPDEVRDRVTSPLRTVLDCSAWLPFREGLAVADSALRAGAVGEQELRAAADRRTGRGSVRARRVAAHADGRAANPFESAVRGTLLENGLTGFEPQVWVDLADGRRIRVDLADEALQMVAEADSFTWHGNRKALADDCRRYDETVRTGRTVLRVAWEQAMFEEEWLGQLLVDVADQQRAGQEALRRRRSAGRRRKGPESSPSVPAPRHAAAAGVSG